MPAKKFAGAYLGCQSALDLSVTTVLERWITDHVCIQQATGLGNYLFDSFYNLAFTPISFRGCRPHTMWRSTLESVRRLHQAGIQFHIESFGPIGRAQHGHPKTYDHSCAFICLGVGLGDDYTTMPSGHPLSETHPDGRFALLGSRTSGPGIHSAVQGRATDRHALGGRGHRQALADYHRVLPQLRHRSLQRDGSAVVWHDATRCVTTIFNFKAREVTVAGAFRDITNGQNLPTASSYQLAPWTTYQVSSLDR